MLAPEKKKLFIHNYYFVLLAGGLGQQIQLLKTVKNTMHKARLYSSANAVQRRDAACVLSRYLPLMNWPEQCDVLDVGCGSGDVTRELLLPELKSCRTLVATDISADMVNHARRVHEEQEPRLQFHCLDIATRERPRSIFPEGFHKIFSFYCLHWVQEQRLALSNMHSFLEPGGDLLLAFVAYHPVFTAYERLATSPSWEPYMRDVSRFVSPYQHSLRPAAELRQHLEHVGFSVHDCECLENSYTFQSSNLIRSAVSAVNPFLERIPRSMHEAFLNDCVVETESQGVKQQDGTIVFTYNLLVVFASK